MKPERVNPKSTLKRNHLQYRGHNGVETEGALSRLEVKKLWAAATYEQASPLGKD